MKDYVRIENVSSKSVDSYLQKGWEVIETLRYSEEYGNHNRVEYHIGLPARVWANQLLGVIKQYEEKGFKEKLFEAIAEENGEDLANYSESGFMASQDATALYIGRYETVVKNKEVSIYNEKQNYSL